MREAIIISMIVGIVGYSVGGIVGTVSSLICLLWIGLIVESQKNG